jgi:hypothetical protein
VGKPAGTRFGVGEGAEDTSTSNHKPRIHSANIMLKGSNCFKVIRLPPFRSALLTNFASPLGIKRLLVAISALNL